MAALERGEMKRTRKQIVNQLVHMELVEDRKLLLKKPPKKKKVTDDTIRMKCVGHKALVEQQATHMQCNRTIDTQYMAL